MWLAELFIGRVEGEGRRDIGGGYRNGIIILGVVIVKALGVGRILETKSLVALMVHGHRLGRSITRTRFLNQSNLYGSFDHPFACRGLPHDLKPFTTDNATALI